MTKQGKHGLILRQTNDGWQICAANSASGSWESIPGGAMIAPLQLATAASEFAKSHRLGSQVAIALHSNTTLPANLAVEDAAELRDRRAMAYKIEELLPIAAEDFVADYYSQDKQVLSVATATDDLLPTVSALESAKLEVQTIAPAAITAMQSLYESSNKPNHDLVIWQDADAVEMFRGAQRPLHWLHLPAETSTVAQRVAADGLRNDGAFRVLLLGVDPQLQSELEQLNATTPFATEIESRQTAGSLADHVRSGASLALAGKSKPWIELRRGSLMAGDPIRAVRREWQWLIAAVACFLLSLVAFFAIRGYQYHRLQGDIQQQQQDIFRDVFPKSRMPTAVASRLKSEHKKLLGARGKEAAVQLPPSALNVLHQLVNGMPTNLRIQVDQIRIENGKIDVDASVRSVGQAGELADALQKHGFTIGPPTTQQTDAKSVSVRIDGRLEPRFSDGANP